MTERFIDGGIRKLKKAHQIISQLSHLVDNMDECEGEDWVTKGSSRSFFWKNKGYNLIENYSESGEPSSLYVNISSFPLINESEIAYHDYELDVYCKYGGEVKVLDEDEFLKATNQYNYNSDFIKQCRESVNEATELINNWKYRGI
ncbi:DUF402 domain-containing protein [Paenibacillus mesophilus]|nr:DUF402 domain-containing protein [Paenibacillus mesophilus]